MLTLWYYYCLIQLDLDDSDVCGMLILVSLKSSADHVGECFCLSVSPATVTSSSGGPTSAASSVSLGCYSLTVQRQVVTCTS